MYVNLNGDSQSRLEKDAVANYKAATALVKTIAEGQSLYHARNSRNAEEVSAMRMAHEEMLIKAIEIQEHYFSIWEELNQ